MTTTLAYPAVRGEVCVGTRCTSWAPCKDAMACTCEYYFNDLYCFDADWRPLWGSASRRLDAADQRRLEDGFTRGGWATWDESYLRYPLSTNEKWMSLWLSLNETVPAGYDYNSSVLDSVELQTDDKWAPWAACAALYTIEMSGNALSGWGGATYTVTKCTKSKGKWSCSKNDKVTDGDLSKAEGSSATEQFFLCPTDTCVREEAAPCSPHPTDHARPRAGTNSR